MPQPPPRNIAGEVQPHDHAEILSQHVVIRRISDKQIVFDGNGQRRISSIAYKPSSRPPGGMSIDIEPFIVAKALNPKEYVTTPVWMGSVWFLVETLRADSLLVGYDPLPTNDAHGEVWGADTRPQWRKLQRVAAWYVEIPGVGLL